MSDAPRDRLLRYFAKYAPEKIANVDAALKAFTGREEQMFETLKKKYGPEPAADDPAVIAALKGSASGPTSPTSPGPAAAAAAPAAAGGSNPAFRARLLRFLQKYDPSKVGSVDVLVSKAGPGQEEVLMKKLVDRFGPEPPDPNAAAPAAGGDGGGEPMSPTKSVRIVEPQASPEDVNSTRARLIRFYKKYSPDKLENVDTALKAYAGREAKMFEALVKKYGPEPATNDPAVQDATPIPNSADNLVRQAAERRAMSQMQAASDGDDTPRLDYRTRFQRFLQKYQPDKLSQLDTILQSYAGREDAVLKALVQKHGPEPDPDEVLPQVAQQAPARARASTYIPADDYLARVRALLEKYAPEKIQNAPTMLKRYRGKEEELIKSLVEKLGPEPLPPGSPTPDGGWVPAQGSMAASVEGFSQSYAEPASPEETRARLLRFYEKYAPERIAMVDEILPKFLGRETVMFDALVKRYGPEPPTPMTKEQYRERLIDYLTARAPDKVPVADQMLDKYAGREEELFVALSGKLGPEPQRRRSSVMPNITDMPANSGGDDGGGEAMPASTSASPSASGESRFAPRSTPGGEPLSYRDRLTRYFTARAPERLPQVDELLAKYAGKEEQMMEALVSRMGPEPEPEVSAGGGGDLEPLAGEPGSPLGAYSGGGTFSPKLHVLSRIGTNAAEKLRTTFAKMFFTQPPAPLTAEEEDFFYTTLLVSECADLGSGGDPFGNGQYPRDATDADRAAFTFLSTIFQLKADADAATHGIEEEEVRAFQALVAKRKADHERVMELSLLRQRQRQAIVAKAGAMIRDVETKLRKEIENTWQLETAGREKWFTETRDHILMCTPPSEITQLEERLARVKKMVQENDDDMRDWAHRRHRQRVDQQRVPDQLSTWNTPSTNAEPNNASSMSTPRSARGLRNIVSPEYDKIRAYGTVDSDYFPGKQGSTPRRQTPAATVSTNGSPLPAISNLAAEVASPMPAAPTPQRRFRDAYEVSMMSSAAATTPRQSSGSSRPRVQSAASPSSYNGSSNVALPRPRQVGFASPQSAKKDTGRVVVLDNGQFAPVGTLNDRSAFDDGTNAQHEREWGQRQSTGNEHRRLDAARHAKPQGLPPKMYIGTTAPQPFNLSTGGPRRRM